VASSQLVANALLDLGLDARPSYGLATLCPMRLGARQASVDPCHDHAAFKLRKHAHHAEHRFAGRRGGIERLLVKE